MIYAIFISLLFLYPPTLETYHFEADDNIHIKKVEIDQYGLNYIDEAFIDNHKLLLLMDELEREVYKKPVNAKFSDNGEIIPGKPGETLDRRKFQSLFRRYYYRDTEQKLTIPKRLIEPKVDRGLLLNISERQLGSYMTYYKQHNKGRSHNITLATRAINNTVVFPGETFSFNGTVGQRTVEKGYKRAPVIVKGELSEDIGGGICQVSSTLFNAVDLSGIQMIERYSHSRRVPYVPEGRDATVSWWGPDFVFKNLYNEPILIRAKAEDGKMIVAIYSSESVENFDGK